jgi:hypothetical protein
MKKIKLLIKQKQKVLDTIKQIKSSNYEHVIDGVSSYNTTYNYSKDNIFHPILDAFLNIAGPGYEILDFWFNIYGPRGHVKPHGHAEQETGGDLKSGVYYFQKPIQSGNLILDKQVVEVEEDDLILFDSHLKHSSEPNRSNQDRIIFSCNLARGYKKILKEGRWTLVKLL